MNRKPTFTDSELREALRRQYADAPRLSGDFCDKVLQRMNLPERKPYRFRRWAILASPVAAAVAFGLFLLGRQGGTVPPSPSPQVSAAAQVRTTVEESAVPPTLPTAKLQSAVRKVRPAVSRRTLPPEQAPSAEGGMHSDMVAQADTVFAVSPETEAMLAERFAGVESKIMEMRENLTYN